MSIFRGNIVQKLKCIVKNRFRKEVLSEAYLPDIKYGGEWLSLGVMTLSLLERHGRLKYLGDVILNWMISLSSHFQKFPCLEKLYALWACSASSSFFMKSHKISQQEKDCILKEFKERGTGLLKKQSTCSNSSKYTAKVGYFHECGVDLVNGFFCRSVKIVDGGTLKSTSELVRGFSSKFVDDDEFADTLRSHLDDILKLKDRDRVNGFWTLLFYVTHVILIQTEYMTMVTTVGSSQLRNFISDFCIIAGQNEVIQMADSLSEILLCVDMCEKNKYAIYKMTEALLKMVTSSGDLQQNDDALGEREDLHSKLTKCAALINVLIFIDSEVSEMAVEKALKPKKGK